MLKDRFVGSFAMPEDPPRACSEAAECGHPGTPARRCQPQLGALNPINLPPAASQQPRDRPVPSVCRQPGRRTELSARSGRHVRTPRGKSASMTLTAEVRSRETPAILKRPLPRADTPASCVLSNLGAAGRGCSPRPRRPSDPLSGVEAPVQQVLLCSPGESSIRGGISLARKGRESTPHLAPLRHANHQNVRGYPVMGARLLPVGSIARPSHGQCAENGKAGAERGQAPRCICESNRHAGMRGD